jgi:alanine-glyoxylate transaminase/serine-glyoxylate transaminase/serine-pyruvate transaminase
VLVLVNGVFGKRMQDLAMRLGAETDVVEFEWGAPVATSSVKSMLDKKRHDIVAVVHAETSTGVCNPVEEIAPLVRDSGALYLVDTVTSLGGIPVEIDGWNVDAVYSGTQKCLSCPPGLAPVSFSPRAVEKIRRRKTKVPNWYLDVSMIINYWTGTKRAYHHTAPINMLYGLHSALTCIGDEGMDAVFARHRDAHLQLVTGLESMGLELLVDSKHRLPMLNAVRVPDGIDEAAVRLALLKDDRIEISAGLGPLAGKIWRIGIMGHTARPENVERIIKALAAKL